MAIQLFIGTAVGVANVIVQVLAVALIIRYLSSELARPHADLSGLRQTITLSTIVVLMLAAHLVQIGIWAILFKTLGEFNTITAAFYHSTVNFSTLGYGDIVMTERWRFLGAFEAVNGVLMMGISAASFFAVMAKLLDQRVHEARKRLG